MPKKNISHRSPSIKYKPLKMSDGNHNLDYDQTGTCCGVLEIGVEDYEDFKLYKHSVESERHWADWDPSHSYDSWLKPRYEKKATLRETVRAFRDFLQRESLHYGMAVAYLLPDQHNGTLGKVLKACGFKVTHTFWNPKTKNTLHHYVLVMNKRAPRKSTRKSVLS